MTLRDLARKDVIRLSNGENLAASMILNLRKNLPALPLWCCMVAAAAWGCWAATTTL